LKATAWWENNQVDSSYPVAEKPFVPLYLLQYTHTVSFRVVKSGFFTASLHHLPKMAGDRENQPLKAMMQAPAPQRLCAGESRGPRAYRWGAYDSYLQLMASNAGHEKRRRVRLRGIPEVHP
jgi:hypothetical protein